MENQPKHFDKWNKVKFRLHFANNFPLIKEGQVWWCAVGENIGAEINGKNKTFARPVVILRKLNSITFMGVPLTTKHHDGSWYVAFYFKNTSERAVLAQARVYSVSRLYDKIGMLSSSDLELIRRGFRKLYF